MLSAGPVCSCAHFFVHIAHETAGAARTRSSLRPLIPEGQATRYNSGASRRENALAKGAGTGQKNCWKKKRQRRNDLTIKGKAYIAGIYEHPTRHAPDKSTAQLHAEVAKGAIEDAGLTK